LAIRNNDPYFGIYTNKCIDFQPKVREGLFKKSFPYDKVSRPECNYRIICYFSIENLPFFLDLKYNSNTSNNVGKLTP
jgi:hypothetical protein